MVSVGCSVVTVAGSALIIKVQSIRNCKSESLPIKNRNKREPPFTCSLEIKVNLVPGSVISCSSLYCSIRYSKAELVKAKGRTFLFVISTPKVKLEEVT